MDKLSRFFRKDKEESLVIALDPVEFVEKVLSIENKPEKITQVTGHVGNDFREAKFQFDKYSSVFVLEDRECTDSILLKKLMNQGGYEFKEDVNEKEMVLVRIK